MNQSKINIKIFSLFKNFLGDDLSKMILHKKYINKYKKNKLIFVHIPKSAGTSIAEKVYGKRNGHLTAKQIKYYLGNKVYNSKITFSVTRNPYDRLLSAYYFIKQGGTNEGGVSNDILQILKEFNTFDSFVKDWLQYQDENSVDILFKPQYLYLFENNKLIVRNLFKLEEIDKLKMFLFNNLAISASFEKRNESNRSRKFMNEYTNVETKKIVEKFYENDFNLLGYFYE